MSAAEYIIREKTEYEKTAVFFACTEKEPQVRTCLSMGFDDAFVINCSVLQAEGALSSFLKERLSAGDAVACSERCWDDGICPAAPGISERTGTEVEEFSAAGVVPHTPSIRDIMGGMGKAITVAEPEKTEDLRKIKYVFSPKISKKCIFLTHERNDILRLISALRLI